MSQEMLDLCAQAIAAAKKAGAADSKATLTRLQSIDIQYRQRKPETIKQSATQSLDVEIYVDGRYSRQTTSDLRPSALTDFIENAVATTRLLAEDRFRCLPEPRRYQGRPEGDLRILDPGFSGITLEQRHQVAKRLEESALLAGGSQVLSVTAGIRDLLYEMTAVTSNGLSGEVKTSEFHLSGLLTLQDTGDRRPNGYHEVTTRFFDQLPDPATVGEELARRTKGLLGARKLATESLPVIVENRVARRLLQNLIEPLSGWAIQQKRSFLAGKKGQAIGSKTLTLIDDGALVGGLMSAGFDRDGFPSRPRVMIDKGVLKEFFVDWYHSRKLGCEPTTGWPSNIIVPPGTRPLAEIMKSLDRGIVVTEFIGGNANSTTGDVSVGILGYLFENGTRTQAVSEMNIADNQLKLWPKLVEVANDPWMYDAWRTPSLVFKDIMVSGA